MLKLNYPATLDAIAGAYNQMDARDAVLALQPTIMLEAHSQFIRTTQGGGFGWINLADRSCFVPAIRDVRPLFRTAGSGLALRMGWDGLTGGSIENGCLRNEWDRPYWGAGKFTALGVQYIPPRGTGDPSPGATSGNAVFGNRNPSSISYLNVVNTTGKFSALLASSSLLGDNTDLTTLGWHSWMLSHDNSLGTKQAIYINGSVSTTANTTPSNGSTSLDKQILIGGRKTQPDVTFIGDIGAFLFFDGVAMHDPSNSAALSVLNSYLNELVAQRS